MINFHVRGGDKIPTPHNATIIEYHHYTVENASPLVTGCYIESGRVNYN